MGTPFETVCDITVRYSETDKMGIVYHANYLVWLEIARTDFLEKLGFPYIEVERQGIMSPVVSCDLNYHMPCTYGDIVRIYTHVEKLTPVRTVYGYRLYAVGDDESAKPRFEGQTMHCLVESETFRPVNQKKRFPDLHAAYEKALG